MATLIASNLVSMSKGNGAIVGARNVSTIVLQMRAQVVAMIIVS